MSVRFLRNPYRLFLEKGKDKVKSSIRIKVDFQLLVNLANSLMKLLNWSLIALEHQELIRRLTEQGWHRTGETGCGAGSGDVYNVYYT